MRARHPFVPRLRNRRSPRLDPSGRHKNRRQPAKRPISALRVAPRSPSRHDAQALDDKALRGKMSERKPGGKRRIGTSPIRLGKEAWGSHPCHTRTGRDVSEPRERPRAHRPNAANCTSAEQAIRTSCPNLLHTRRQPPHKRKKLSQPKLRQPFIRRVEPDSASGFGFKTL